MKNKYKNKLSKMMKTKTGNVGEIGKIGKEISKAVRRDI